MQSCLLLQGVVIGTGENSEFGDIFKMMKAEEVSPSHDHSTFHEV